MFIFHRIKDLQQYLHLAKLQFKSIGFVPTMGALHQGHITLITSALQHTDISVCSIYVNPTQFNNAEDLKKYPKTLDSDIQKLEQAGCQVLYLPIDEEIYPNGMEQLPKYELGTVAEVLEGSFRPGHFQGVAVIIDTLLQIVQPDQLFMGQKDYQQCMVVKRLLELTKSNVTLNIVPTKREADGLAMSSRNLRLTEGERQQSNLLYQCLVSVQAQQNQKSFSIVYKECYDLLLKKGIELEYLKICNAITLSELTDFDSNQPLVVLIAAYVGQIRLIDNLVL